VKYIFTLALLMPGTLNAMEDTPATTTQEPQNALPLLRVVMTLTDPAPTHTSDSGQWRSERICKAMPNATGGYDIEQFMFLDNGVDYVALLTSLRLDPASPHPVITYRLGDANVPKEEMKNPGHEDTDFELSVPYNEPRNLKVELENQTLTLEIKIETN
jgi:hypothetical protein